MKSSPRFDKRALLLIIDAILFGILVYGVVINYVPLILGCIITIFVITLPTVLSDLGEASDYSATHGDRDKYRYVGRKRK